MPKPTLANLTCLPAEAIQTLKGALRGEKLVPCDQALVIERSIPHGNGLATDIQRHLEDELVEAGPPNAADRFPEFARRNEAVLITTTAVAASLIIGLRRERVRPLEAEALPED